LIPRIFKLYPLGAVGVRISYVEGFFDTGRRGLYLELVALDARKFINMVVRLNLVWK
jgi:hypothetical protein